MRTGIGNCCCCGRAARCGVHGDRCGGRGSADTDVTMVDRCDPATFNAAVRPGTCVYGPGSNQRGTITFPEFAASLNPTDFGDDHWTFNPSDRNADVGRGLRFAVHNEGGEFHTFTRVANFGGGCVPEVSGPLGLTPVPECAAVVETPDGPVPARVHHQRRPLGRRSLGQGRHDHRRHDQLPVPDPSVDADRRHRRLTGSTAGRSSPVRQPGLNPTDDRAERAGREQPRPQRAR